MWGLQTQADWIWALIWAALLFANVYFASRYAREHGQICLIDIPVVLFSAAALAFEIAGWW